MTAERPFTVSTGHSLIVTPREMAQIYGDLHQERNFRGVEAIGWIWSSLFLPGLRAQKFDVIGLHGRTSAYLESSQTKDHLFAFFTNALVLSTSRLLELASQQPGLEYALVHADELQVPKRQSQIDALLGQNQNPESIFFIENNSRLRGLDVALYHVYRLLSKGINAGLAFDMVHFFSECNGGANEKMADTINRLGDILSKVNFPVIVHIPIGRNPGDSLPMDEIDHSQWQRLNNVMDCKVRQVVLESQAPVRVGFWPTHLILNSQQRQIHRDHFCRQLDKLKQAGIV